MIFATTYQVIEVTPVLAAGLPAMSFVSSDTGVNVAAMVEGWPVADPNTPSLVPRPCSSVAGGAVYFGFYTLTPGPCVCAFTMPASVST